MYTASLAIFLSCLGLFGLTAFGVQRRIKEIGIRKVPGSSIINVITLFTKSCAKWVVLANIISWPIAYYSISKWLENFPYRTTIGIEIFVLSALLVQAIALLTIGFPVQPGRITKAGIGIYQTDIFKIILFLLQDSHS